VGAFYDATLDRWSLPRQLTSDEDVEKSLALGFDGTNVVVAYLRTATVRTNIDLDIDGQPQHIENVPRPGRTDLCLLRYLTGIDLAVRPESLLIDPPNPAPGSQATNKVIVENRGESAAQNFQVTFYDGDPSTGGAPIGSQTVAAPLVG